MTIGNGHKLKTWRIVKAICFTLVLFGVASLWAEGPAQAQITFDVIGPHEYDLPVDFTPFNVFVQYGIEQDNNWTWDSHGHKIRGNGSQLTEGLSKFVHFWNFNKNVGLAYEVIQPEVGIRFPNSNYVSGFADTLTGFATWFKPTPKSTLGLQSFLQIPWGGSAVSDTNWKNYTSLLWYTPLFGKFDWTGDAGFVAQSAKADNAATPGFIVHTNNRFGYQLLKWLEPFAAVDYEHVSSRGISPEGWDLDGGLGFMVSYYKSQSITLRYSRSLAGKNHAYDNSWNLRYIYVW